ncbi:nitrous oxide reductase accessory protein NosL [Thalassotalea sp. G2M2-11]|uniref:nitrous oxide reductase accessory protein NosL n=1 Tax=Thalassotalea sp. G2M2-11 TaxID=2787627 RepID=UPI0019D0A62A|nr:nitrous oxide reductase accessory protein NosL [Thalassotalea sp. G2M2-11]
MKQLSILLAITLLFISACSKQEENHQTVLPAVAIETSDECHLCGMLVANFSGPKAELYKNGVNQQESSKVHKFCSTRDMFSFYLDPENKRNVTTIYVHDMSKSPWDEPNDSYFIDARTAWFVAGSNKTGAMGATLASFAKKVDAQQFAQEFGGQVLSFEQVDLSVLM